MEHLLLASNSTCRFGQGACSFLTQTMNNRFSNVGHDTHRTCHLYHSMMPRPWCSLAYNFLAVLAAFLSISNVDYWIPLLAKPALTLQISSIESRQRGKYDELVRMSQAFALFSVVGDKRRVSWRFFLASTAWKLDLKRQLYRI